jgi:hypothetical protein
MENLENHNPEEEHEEESLFRDKIFDNDFENTELDTTETKFSLDTNFAEKTLDDKIDETMFYADVSDFIKSNNRLHTLNSALPSGGFPKINKSEINEIYRCISESLTYIPKIEVFSIVTSIYDISPDKFYESLSNTFKTELITELKRRGYLKNHKSLF